MGVALAEGLVGETVRVRVEFLLRVARDVDCFHHRTYIH
jgi:hypothetical protein